MSSSQRLLCPLTQLCSRTHTVPVLRIGEACLPSVGGRAWPAVSLGSGHLKRWSVPTHDQQRRARRAALRLGGHRLSRGWRHRGGGDTALRVRAMVAVADSREARGRAADFTRVTQGRRPTLPLLGSASVTPLAHSPCKRPHHSPLPSSTGAGPSSFATAIASVFAPLDALALAGVLLS